MLRFWPSQADVGRDWMKDTSSRYVPDLEDILSERPPRSVRSTHFMIATLFVGLIVISSLVSVDIIVTGSGRLSPDAPTIVVQPMQLSIIRDVRVKPGDMVRRGDVLATLDPTFTQADKSALLTQQKAAQAQIARLEAELAGKPLTLTNEGGDNLIQLTLYEQRTSQYVSRLAAFDEDIQRFKADAVATESNRGSLLQQIEVARELETLRGDLFEKRLGSKIFYLEARTFRMRAERELQDASNHLNGSWYSMQSKMADRQAFVDEWRRQLLEELVRARAQESVVGETLAKAVMMNDLVTLIAPADGVVLTVAKRSVGSVLNQAEPLVTLIPTSAALIAEVMINSADVGYIMPGQEVALKVDAFPFQRHGMLTGSLRAVGAESFGANEGGGGTSSYTPPIPGGYHRSQIELTNATLRGIADKSNLIAGMTLTAEIKVGSRSVISYFLYPIRRGLSESLREP